MWNRCDDIGPLLAERASGNLGDGDTIILGTLGDRSSWACLGEGTFDTMTNRFLWRVEGQGRPLPTHYALASEVPLPIKGLR